MENVESGILAFAGCGAGFGACCAGFGGGGAVFKAGGAVFAAGGGAVFAAAGGAVAAWHYHRLGLTLTHYDARGHLVGRHPVGA